MEQYSLSLKLDLTSIKVSRDSQYMLVNMSDSEIQLFDIETAEVVRRFTGQKQAEFMIRSTFGGAAENFIVSGSEGKYYYSKISLFNIFTNYKTRFQNLHLAQRE